MNKIWIIIICVILFNPGISIAEETVHLANGEWAPYFSKNLKYYGIGSRIVTEAFALEGIRVKYSFFPWKRALKIAQDGDLHGVVGFEINSERASFFYASDNVWEAPWVFFHLKTYQFDWKTFDDLRAKKIGASLEYMYTPEFLEAEHSGMISVDRAPTDLMGFKKLLIGRLDIFPQLVDVGYYQLEKLFDTKTVKLFTHHPTPIGKHTEQLLLSKKHEQSKRLIIVFNRGLKRLKDSGLYEKFIEESHRNEYRGQ